MKIHGFPTDEKKPRVLIKGKAVEVESMIN